MAGEVCKTKHDEPSKYRVRVKIRREVGAVEDQVLPVNRRAKKIDKRAILIYLLAGVGLVPTLFESQE
jgi:hypothetical protein